MKLKIRITKCYLVEIIDEEGNSILCEYVFGDKEEANDVAKSLKESVKQEIEDER